MPPALGKTWSLEGQMGCGAEGDRGPASCSPEQFLRPFYQSEKELGMGEFSPVKIRFLSGPLKLSLCLPLSCAADNPLFREEASDECCPDLTAVRPPGLDPGRLQLAKISHLCPWLVFL